VTGTRSIAWLVSQAFLDSAPVASRVFSCPPLARATAPARRSPRGGRPISARRPAPLCERRHRLAATKLQMGFGILFEHPHCAEAGACKTRCTPPSTPRTGIVSDAGRLQLARCPTPRTGRQSGPGVPAPGLLFGSGRLAVIGTCGPATLAHFRPCSGVLCLCSRRLSVRPTHTGAADQGRFFLSTRAPGADREARRQLLLLSSRRRSRVAAAREAAAVHLGKPAAARSRGGCPRVEKLATSEGRFGSAARWPLLSLVPTTHVAEQGRDSALRVA
jgi:hypothetical protein